MHERKLAAGEQEAVKTCKSTLPVAWRDVNLVAYFDFSTKSTTVDIEALAAHYQMRDFRRRSVTEENDDGA